MFQLVDFALLYGIHNQDYYHLVVSTMTICSFGAMCRYIDVTCLKWSNVRFGPDPRFLKLLLKKRKNTHFRQGTRLLATTNALVCPLKLSLTLKDNDVNYAPDAFIFRGSNGRLVAKNLQNIISCDVAIKYQQYIRYLSLWSGGILGLFV